jgi:DNA-binding PadR family transcriptional regulator
MHGYGIAQHIQQTSEDMLVVEEGSLYPALQRMLIKGWLVAEWKQIGKQPPRPLLPADARGTQATRRGIGRV